MILTLTDTNYKLIYAALLRYYAEIEQDLIDYRDKEFVTKLLLEDKSDLDNLFKQLGLDLNEE